MTDEQVEQLHGGDEVFWNDPAEECSRIYRIQTIEVNGDIVMITEPDGSCLECYAEELS